MSVLPLSILLLSLSTPSFAAKKTYKMRKRQKNALRYDGFGGVGLGFVSYLTPGAFERNESQSSSLDQVISSEFFHRVGKSNIFVGYSVGLQGSSRFQRTFIPIDGWNEKFESEHYDCWGDICLGTTEVSFIDLLHLPIETNTIYNFDWKRIKLYAGGGPSIHYYKIHQYYSYSSLQFDEPFAYEEAWLTTSSAEAETDVTRKYAVGGQVLAGAAIELGKIPKIGGRWGLSFSGKLQMVRTIDYEATANYSYQDYQPDGQPAPDTKEKSTSFESVAIDGSSYGGRIALIYFF